MSLAEEERNHRHACASCKHQRKRCPEDCILAPLFPATRMEEFLAVHKVFGMANVTRMIRNLESGLRGEAVKSFVWFASSWKQDPVHGPLGLYMKSEQRRNFLERRNSFLEQRNNFLEGRLNLLLEQDNYNNVVGMAPNYVENNVDFNHDESSLQELNNYPPPPPPPPLVIGDQETDGHGIEQLSLVKLNNYPPPPPPPLVVGDQEIVGHGIGFVQDGFGHGRGFQGVNANFSPAIEAQGGNGRAAGGGGVSTSFGQGRVGVINYQENCFSGGGNHGEYSTMMQGRTQ